MPYLPMLTAFLVALAAGALLIHIHRRARAPGHRRSRVPGHMSGRAPRGSDPPGGLQKIHDHAVPRLGGLALAPGLAAGALLSPEVGALWPALALAALPALAAGLHEDLTGAGGVRLRLAATIMSGLIFAAASGSAPDRLGLPPVDAVLVLPGVAVMLAGVALGGVANAFNLIDGCHGLSAGTAAILLLGLAGIAADAGDAPLSAAALIVLGAVVGFLVLNFPGGRIFLGDGGAYLAGLTVAALALALPARNPEVAPLTGVLLLAYPISETAHSIARRRHGGARAIGRPDLGHLHSLTYRALSRWLLPPRPRNALTGALLWLLPALSAALAVLLARSGTAAVLTATAGIATLYTLAHAGASAAAALQPEPVAAAAPPVTAEERPAEQRR
ncbi:MraY family glycosyltransferase [Acidimangrovimonas sediminis]|uniref:MraY family glycosyltransferase n=1 Tax=Acidimangrovimonas sediminis TaxID=2056283 RepID=UPI000C804FBB|nr:glycosyltransferase [Acidimangrovimonas sediminis]